MEIDTELGMRKVQEEEQRQKIRDEKKLVDEIYNQYLQKKHPQYPIAKEKLLIEDKTPQVVADKYYKPEQPGHRKLPAPAQHKIDTLGKLDKLQETTIKELDFYNQRQEELNKKLWEQQRVLQAVQNDINKREELLNYVFEHRRQDDEAAKKYVPEHHSQSEDTTSLIISAITTSVMNTNQSESELNQDSRHQQ